MVRAGGLHRLVHEAKDVPVRILKPGGAQVEVPGLVALAAWALEEKLRRGPVAIALCPSCRFFWLPARSGGYCRRPAGYLSLSCRAKAKQEAFERRHPTYDRECKKLLARVRRGSLPRSEYDRWAAANTPYSWTPYDEKEETWQEEAPSSDTTENAESSGGSSSATPPTDK
jgi:hypothetical protein